MRTAGRLAVLYYLVCELSLTGYTCQLTLFRQYLDSNEFGGDSDEFNGDEDGLVKLATG